MFIPDLGSYEDNGRAKKLDYIHNPSNKYQLRIIYHEKDDIWVADKYCEGERIDRYEAPSLEWLMKHILLSGYK